MVTVRDPGPLGLPVASSNNFGGGRIVVRYSAGNVIRLAKKNGAALDLILDIAPYNVNQLMGPVQWGTAANTDGRPSLSLDRAITVIQALSTDMSGPYQMLAHANGDAGAEQWTGGGHNTTGNAAGIGVGTPTARNLSVEVYLDGVPLTADGIAYRGNRVDIRCVNRVQGFNTLTAAREILEETINWIWTENTLEVSGVAVPLERLTVVRDYNIQASNVGMDSVHFPAGSPDTRVALTGSPTAGSLDTAPNVDRFVLHGTASQHLVGWIDRKYGIGTMSGLFHTLAPAFVDSTANKAYFYTIHTGDTDGVGQILDPTGVAGTTSMHWRGGWYFGVDLGTTGADMTYTISNDGRRRYCVDFLAAAAGVFVPVFPEDRNQTVAVISSYGSPVVDSKSTSKGVKITAPGACSVIFECGPNPLFSAPVNGDTQVNPADPTGAAAGAVMMGLGAAASPCLFTPVVSKRALIRFSFQCANSVSSNGVTFSLRYGTGTPPANGAAVTGTLIGVAQTKNNGNAAYSDGETLDGLLLNLVPGTTYWFDLTLQQVSSGTATAKSITFTAIEI